MTFLKSRRFRLIIAWSMMVSSFIGWGLSFWLTDEPPVILSISWLALVYTSYDIICTTELKDEG